MLQNRSRLIAIMMLAGLGLWCPSHAFAQGEQVIFTFAGGSGGAYPVGGLTADSQYNIYGTTKSGGISNCGTVFEIKASTGATFTFERAWTFHSLSAMDGCNPYGSLIIDSSGRVYGTTYAGGAYGYGTVFELMPAAIGGFTEQILWSFGKGEDGGYPTAGLTMDASGNLYGTTSSGGQTHCTGTAFEISPAASGGWTETVLHDFGCYAADGSTPNASLAMDTSGNLYGTTELGGNGTNCGSAGCGTVFELVKSEGFREAQLHSFTGTSDGGFPLGPVVVVNGDVIGTASAYPKQGLVFELINQGSSWLDRALHKFPGQTGDGAQPMAGILASGTSYYGTTLLGGAPCGCGTLFQLHHTKKGWIETVLHSFLGPAIGDGANPMGSLAQDAKGNIYGTTEFGGSNAACFNGCGTIFQLQP